MAIPPTSESEQKQVNHNPEKPAKVVRIKNRVIGLSIGAAVATIILKFTAYLLTGSVGLLSDAMESLVNLVGASAALIALTIAARPPDKSHHFGHQKVEYFSSGLEGGLILLAAGAIAWTALARLFNPTPLDSVDIGLVVSLAATAINFGVARILLRVGRQEDSIVLEADGKHLMTDVVTSVGVVLGVVLVALTGWLWLDPVVALAVAANIIFEGGKLVKRSLSGLVDPALPEEEEKQIRAIIQSVIDQSAGKKLQYHALRTRKSGSARFIDLHLLTPGEWTVQQAHDYAELIEGKIKSQFKEAEITIHVEPLEDPRSFESVLNNGLNL